LLALDDPLQNGKKKKKLEYSKFITFKMNSYSNKEGNTLTIEFPITCSDSDCNGHIFILTKTLMNMHKARNIGSKTIN
jgi:hypothetical protein